MSVTAASSPTLGSIAESVTAGNVLRSVWVLAGPNLATLMLTSINQFMDALFVGGLGKPELAAIGMARSVSMLLMVFTVAVTTGTTALISRFAGAKDMPNSVLTAQQSLRLSLILSLLVGAPLVLLRYQLMIVLGAKSEVAHIGSSYLGIMFATTPVMFLNMTLISIFRGTGQMRTLMLALITMDLVNIPLDYALIYGVPGFIPSLRVPGAALASAIARLIPLIWLLLAVRDSELGAALRGNWFRCDMEWVRRIARIGSPQIVGSLAFNLGRLASIYLINLLPNATVAMAALTYGLACEAMSFMPGFAFNLATATLVGQNLGARQPERAARCARIAMWLASGLMSLIGLILFVFAPAIARGSGKDPEVIAQVIAYLRIGAIAQPLLGVSMTLWGALQGAGDTRYAAVVSMLSNFLVRVPAIWLFAIVLGFGANAVWWTLTLSWVLSTYLLERRFREGKWKTAQV